jgi:hypothetical protein
VEEDVRGVDSARSEVVSGNGCRVIWYGDVGRCWNQSDDRCDEVDKTSLSLSMLIGTGCWFQRK